MSSLFRVVFIYIYLIGCPGGELVREELPVDGVYGHEVLDVAEEDSGPHHAAKAATRLLHHESKF